MANGNQKNIPITDLDFDAIKANLTEFLKDQDQFKDLNFEGAGINIMLDLLAANTHYHSFYINMVANEMFIDSAVTRDAIVSLAKHLGYTPRSVISATARVKVVSATDPFPSQTNKFLSPDTIFQTTINGTTFNFINLAPAEFIEDTVTGEFIIGEVFIREGSHLDSAFVVDILNPDQKFIISDPAIDTTTLIVRIQNSITDVTGADEPWQLVQDLIEVDSDDAAYQLQEVEGGFYELIFGDGIVGRALENGNVIVVDWLSGNAIAPNGAGINDSSQARAFTVAGNFDVIVLDAAAGGAVREPIESIRFFAPLNFQAQERAVTSDDYATIVARDFPDIESIFVFGGEDIDPPQFGKVFISLKPVVGVTISDAEKLTIANTILKRRNVVSITPIVIDPDFTFLLVETEVKYNPRATRLSPSSMEQLVNQIIRDFGDNELEKFDRAFRYSNLVCIIDDGESSILNNATTIKMQKRFEPSLGRQVTYILKYNNPIFHPEDGFQPVLSSTSFGFFDPEVGQIVDAFLDDNGDGLVQVFKLVDLERRIINECQGTINYETGQVELINFQPETLPGTISISVTVQPADLDINVQFNQILSIDPDDAAAVSITITPDEGL